MVKKRFTPVYLYINTELVTALISGINQAVFLRQDQTPSKTTWLGVAVLQIPLKRPHLLTVVMMRQRNSKKRMTKSLK